MLFSASHGSEVTTYAGPFTPIPLPLFGFQRIPPETFHLVLLFYHKCVKNVKKKIKKVEI